MGENRFGGKSGYSIDTD